ncbi:hypothetical protein CN97_00110 [Haematobacter massiliensis]|uniref:Uncharacterized protein n=2 Tax=Haematobacter massiliensis TaxID=195105 RepID=A0A086Y0F7_9RHOB|nr:hypothetical protein CN97_00110 [Haematobacter massiliensis]OWJ82047.1 hypothetical protein CDV51_18480 [Haematobacter massiliensis]
MSDGSEERGMGHTQPDESPLRAMYRRWQEVKAGHRATDDEDEEDRLFDEMLDLEQRAADFEPQTMEDMAFKIVFADDNGDMDMNIHQTALVARAYRIVGIEPLDRFGKSL